MQPPATRIAFLLIDNYSLMAFASAMEPFRQANRLAGRQLYEWWVCSISGESVQCSANIRTDAEYSIDSTPLPDLLLIISGDSKPLQNEAEVHKRLRILAGQGCWLGGLSVGSYILARAGVLDEHKCTVHWEYLESFKEQFPRLDITGELFEIDGARLTCSGGSACMDLMLNYIAANHGRELSRRVAEVFIHERVRDNNDQQRQPLRTRLGVSHPKLLHCLELIEQDTDVVLMQNELAEKVGLSNRQLERLFQKYLHTTPSRYCMDHRLRRARSMLRNTSRSIIDIAVACGFSSHSHFSKSYRDHFSITPNNDRLSA
ncbi:MAG: transcriptional regulator GlxA family with amidase domain [Parasphingorhabdus sp.]|jgi:transcriptional regulator GlxA family with amidase domain